MSDSHRALYDRLVAFRIDPPDAVLTFEARLARDNGWSLPHARRVVAEYKRFLFLAATADHVVSPSEEVDAAWHLHLTYTRNYWDRLCGEVLGRPLHHDPTRGGADEERKFRGLYAQTLRSYTAAFAAPPPADIWPGATAVSAVRHAATTRPRTWMFAAAPLLLAASLPLAAVDAAPVLVGIAVTVIGGLVALVALAASFGFRRGGARGGSGAHHGGGCGGGGCGVGYTGHDGGDGGADGGGDGGGGDGGGGGGCGGGGGGCGGGGCGGGD